MFGKVFICLVCCGSVMPAILAPYGVKMCHDKCSQISGCHWRFLKKNLTCAINVVEDCAILKGKMLFYKGTMNITRSGLMCQRWDQQYPYEHRMNSDYNFITGESVTEASNYCRNIREESWTTSSIPWCYTTSVTMRWQFCQVEVCGLSRDQTTECATFNRSDGRIIYKGTKNTTVSGLTCQRWDSKVPHRHYTNVKKFKTGESLHELANYCRTVPDSLQLPWCITTHRKVKREICVTSVCP